MADPEPRPGGAQIGKISKNGRDAWRTTIANCLIVTVPSGSIWRRAENHQKNDKILA